MNFKNLTLPNNLEKFFLTFQSNLRRAEELNTKGSATFGVTKFMDLSPEEFRAIYLMNREEKKIAGTVEPKIDSDSLPSTFDWRTKSAVTAVKNQAQCGSCWAFSATETIESYWFLQTGKALTNFSPQQIVDCDTDCYGCDGGWTQNAFNYVISAGGIDTESSYPYAGQDETCQSSSGTIGGKISAWAYVTEDEDETQMQNFLVQNGPLSVCVDAESWQYYTGGVITPDQCGDSVDHCVVVTGYSPQTGVTAWNVRNSWGTDWGMEGYLYVQLGSNVCAIASTVTAVTASK